MRVRLARALQEPIRPEPKEPKRLVEDLWTLLSSSSYDTCPKASAERSANANHNRGGASRPKPSTRICGDVQRTCNSWRRSWEISVYHGATAMP
jgi:hypothetical protein